ncbi:hypothetical protein HYV69_02435 [Candidatus Uhrbacteria bacterium]|nr:hypothetical protein [Candidatus Uhrbacteria bacterium]
MSRIEKGSDVREELQQMKGEVIKEIGSTKQRHPFRSCFAIFFILIVLFSTAIAWALASTGIVYIPVFTQFTYQKPEPGRLVSPGVPVEKVIEEQVLSKLAAGSVNEVISLSLSESSLTASLRDILENAADGFIDSSFSQVTISQDKGLTLFLPLENSKSGSAILFSIKANVKDGKIELVPEELKIGSLFIPDSLTNLFLRSIIQDRLANGNKMLESYVQIQDIEYKDGSVIVRGKIAAEIKGE